MDIGAFKRYLANGDTGDYAGLRIPHLAPVADAAPGDVTPRKEEMAKTFLKKTLTEHDKIYHPNGYKKGDDCNFRKMFDKADNVDTLLSEKPKKEEKMGVVKFEETPQGEKKIVDIVELEDTPAEEHIDEIAKKKVEKYLEVAEEKD